MKCISLVAIAAAALCGGMLSVASATIVVMDPTHHNGSFESPVISGNTTFSVTPPTGWVSNNPNTDQLLKNIAAAVDGSQWVELSTLSGIGTTNNTGELVGENVAYTLSAWMSHNNDNQKGTVTLSATQNADGTGLSQVIAYIELLTSTGVFFPSADFVTTTAAPTDPGIANYFLQVNLASVAPSGPNRWVDYDDVRVTGEALSIPEPVSSALIGMASLGLLIRRRQRA